MTSGDYIDEGRAVGGWLRRRRDLRQAMIVGASVMASSVIAPTLGYGEGQKAYPNAPLPGETQAPLSIQQEVAARVKTVVHDQFKLDCKDLVITKIDEHPCGAHGTYRDTSNGVSFSEEAWWVMACGHLEVTQVRLYHEPTGGLSFKVFISGPCI